MAGEKIYIADKETLDKIYNILAADPVYGFIEHNDILSPTERIEYIGANKNFRPITVTMGGGYSLGDWADFPVLKGNKPWMVSSDGTPDYRLNENDYTLKEDGTASDVANTSYNGGAFAWIPKIYKQEYMVGNDRVVKFSMSKRDGFEAVGFIDYNDNELEGVWIPMFYGSIESISYGRMTSISGTRPTCYATTEEQNNAIGEFSTRAVFFGGAIVQTITDLLIMFAKTTDTQGAYGYGNSFGYDSRLGPTFGVKLNEVVDGGQFYGTTDGRSLNKILHSIVLGSYQQWLRDPYISCENGRMKVSKNYIHNTTGAGRTDTGIVYTVDSVQKYPNEYRTVNGFGSIPVEPFRGSSATGGCDGFIVNTGIKAVALRFGDCDAGYTGGLRALYMCDEPIASDWYIGAAILLLPPVGVSA